MGILILIGSIDYPEKYDLYLLTEQLQQVQSTWFWMCQGLVLALSMFVFLFAEEKHLACELTVAQMTYRQLIKLHKLIHLFVHLDIYLVLLLGQHHQHIRAGLDQLQRDSSDEEPECDDFMHSMLVVHLDPGLLVSNY